MSPGSTCPGAAGLRRQQPDDAAVAERDQRVDQGVDEVAVVVAPPQQDHVDDVVVVLVDQRGAGQGGDRGPEGVVAVVVVPELLHDLAGRQPEPAGQAIPFRVARGRAHAGASHRRLRLPGRGRAGFFARSPHVHRARTQAVRAGIAPPVRPQPGRKDSRTCRDRVVAVEVDQADRLPGAERHLAVQHRDGGVRRAQRRQHMVAAVPRRAVPVPPPVVPGQQLAQRGQQVLVAAGARLEHRQPGGGVRHPHVQQPVAGPDRRQEPRRTPRVRSCTALLATGPDRSTTVLCACRRSSGTGPSWPGRLPRA